MNLVPLAKVLSTQMIQALTIKVKLLQGTIDRNLILLLKNDKMFF